MITWKEQQECKPIALNAKTKWEQIKVETEDYDFANLIGKSFFYELKKNKDNYVDLLNGCEFENCNGELVLQQGLKKVLAFLIFANYVEVANMNDTFAGFVQKNISESDAVSLGSIKNAAKKSREIALDFFKTIEEYMQKNEIGTKKTDPKKQVSGLKFYGVKKTKG